MSTRRFKPNRRKILGSFTLSFGRHIGKPLKSIPHSYLRWMIRSEAVPVADLWAASRFLAEHSSRKSKRHALRRSLRQQAKYTEDESSSGFVKSAFPENSGTKPTGAALRSHAHPEPEIVMPVKVSSAQRCAAMPSESENDLDEVLTERPSTPPIERKLTLDSPVTHRSHEEKAGQPDRCG